MALARTPHVDWPLVASLRWGLPDENRMDADHPMAWADEQARQAREHEMEIAEGAFCTECDEEGIDDHNNMRSLS